MGKCTYCGQKVGFLKNKHKECQQKHDNHKILINNLIESTFVSERHFDEIEGEIKKLQQEGFISQKELYQIYIKNFDTAVQQFLYDGILTEKEENKLIEFKEKLKIHERILNKNGLFEELIKVLVIKSLVEKNSLPKYLSNENHNIKLEEEEKIIRSFDDIELYKYNKDLKLIEKNIGFKTKSFDEIPVETKGMKFLSNGKLIITNKYIYFNDNAKIFKTDVGNIIKLTPYEDGLSIRSSKTSLTYKNLDGRFAYNILYNL